MLSISLEQLDAHAKIMSDRVVQINKKSIRKSIRKSIKKSIRKSIRKSIKNQ